jgi:cytidylate kinase
MYRTLAWHCLQKKIDVHDPKAVAAACRRWKTILDCVESGAPAGGRLLSGQGNPHRPVSEAVPHVAAVPQVRAG